MSLKTTFKFDDSITLEWECAGIKPFIESVAFLHELPRVCPVCEAPVRFFFRSPKNFNYYGLKCEGSPVHENNFGQHKEGDTLFYDPSKWGLEYNQREGGNKDGGSPPAQPGSAAPAATQTATPKGDKADITKLNMIGAVARAKKVDGDQVAQTMFNQKVSELSASNAEALLDYLKTL